MAKKTTAEATGTTRITIQHGDTTIIVESNEAKDLVEGITGVIAAGSKFMTDLVVQAKKIKELKAQDSEKR